MSVGDCKPDFSRFLKPIVQHLKKYELGSMFSIEEERRILHCYLLYGVFDKPARSAANNIASSNAYFGCIKCLQKGYRLKTGKSL
jgi:hypothetical protein